MRNFLVFGVAVFVAALLCELMVRWVSPQDLSGTWRVETAEGLRLNRSEGSAMHVQGGLGVKYQFEAPHLRRLQSDGSPSTGAIRVLVLGDSFSFGWLVEVEESFVGRWQALADQAFGAGCICFLNAASGGWGTADQLAYLDEFGADVVPHVVLSVLNRYDVDRSLRSRLYDVAGDIPVRTRGDRRSVAKRLVNALPGYQWALEHSHLVQFMRRAAVHRGDAVQSEPVPGDFEPSDHDAELRAAGERVGRMYYDALLELAREFGAEFFVLSTGWPYAAEATSGFQEGTVAWFGDRGVPYVDLTGPVQDSVAEDLDAFTIENDSHPTPEGHRVIAQNGWPFLFGELAGVVASFGDERCRLATAEDLLSRRTAEVD